MLRPSPTLARKDCGLNDGRRLIAMKLSLSRLVTSEAIIIRRFTGKVARQMLEKSDDITVK